MSNTSCYFKLYFQFRLSLKTTYSVNKLLIDTLSFVMCDHLSLLRPFLIKSFFSHQPTWQTLKHDLVSTLIPVFLANHPNSISVLHYVWHGQVRNILIHYTENHLAYSKVHSRPHHCRPCDVGLSLLINLKSQTIDKGLLRAESNDVLQTVAQCLCALGCLTGAPQPVGTPGRTRVKALELLPPRRSSVLYITPIFA